MSLVNDALRRAKEAQNKSAEPAATAMPAAPQLRPLEPAVAKKDHYTLFLVYAFALVAAFLMGILLHRQQLTQTALAKSPPTPPAATSKSDPTILQPTTTVSANEPAKIAAALPVPPTNSILPLTAAVEPLPPKPAPLKLQAVFFSPNRPSAIINGKTVFVGDRAGGYRVTVIGADSATLVGTNQTLVLTME
jgi:hypothetical protein